VIEKNPYLQVGFLDRVDEFHHFLVYCIFLSWWWCAQREDRIWTLLSFGI